MPGSDSRNAETTRRGLRRVYRRVRHALSQKRKGAPRQPRL